MLSQLKAGISEQFVDYHATFQNKSVVLCQKESIERGTLKGKALHSFPNFSLCLMI